MTKPCLNNNNETKNEIKNETKDKIFDVLTIIYLIYEFISKLACNFNIKYSETKEFLKKKIKEEI